MNDRPEATADFPGQLFIVSAPSGAGKTTLCTAVLERFPDLVYSISYTTRAPRNGETHGIDYFFVPKPEFERKMQEGFWAEWAEVHGHYYGTSGTFIDGELGAGRDILLDIDVQGARQILRRYPDSVTIFIMPPSWETLKRRLAARGTDSRQVIQRRLKAAEAEMAEKHRYRHIIVNEELASAVEDFSAIIRQYRTRAFL